MIIIWDVRNLFKPVGKTKSISHPFPPLSCYELQYCLFINSNAKGLESWWLCQTPEKYNSTKDKVLPIFNRRETSPLKSQQFMSCSRIIPLENSLNFHSPSLLSWRDFLFRCLPGGRGFTKSLQNRHIFKPLWNSILHFVWCLMLVAWIKKLLLGIPFML